MWIVRLALRRPYTAATIDIPVVIVVWSYPGLSAEDIERRVVIITERAFSTTVNGLSRMESQSIDGIGTILTAQQIYDHALNLIRVRLFTIPGLSTPAPYGGKQRQIMVDIDPDAVAARGRSPQGVVAALLSTNAIAAAGFREAQLDALAADGRLPRP